MFTRSPARNAHKRGCSVQLCQSFLQDTLSFLQASMRRFPAEPPRRLRFVGLEVIGLEAVARAFRAAGSKKWGCCDLATRNPAVSRKGQSAHQSLQFPLVVSRSTLPAHQQHLRPLPVSQKGRFAHRSLLATLPVSQKGQSAHRSLFATLSVSQWTLPARKRHPGCDLAFRNHLYISS